MDATHDATRALASEPQAEVHTPGLGPKGEVVEYFDNAPATKDASHPPQDEPQPELSPQPSHASTQVDVSPAGELVEPRTTHEDDHNSDTASEHHLHVTDTLKHVTHTIKRKFYLHNRHQKDLSQQFTAGSAAKHVGPKGRSRPPTANGADNQDPEAQLHLVESANGPTVLQNLWIMVSTFPYWNMAFWSGFSYSIGSAFFVIDGFWSVIPTVWPNTTFSGESEYGVPLWFFFGALLYQWGGVLAYLEAVNDGSFAGAAMKRLLDGNMEMEKELLDAKLHTFFGHLVPHHHANDEDPSHSPQNETQEPESLWQAVTNQSTAEGKLEAAQSHLSAIKEEQPERRGGIDDGAKVREGAVNEYLTWRWWPTRKSLFEYHIRELGYLACAIQLFGVTLYGVTAVVILPGILNNLAWWQELGAYWVPQIVASCCFLTASFMFTIMAQDKWYKPKPGAVSWWIGVWAIAGSVGFLLCAIFGLYSNDHDWAGLQSSISSTWGSFFYMLSGLFQWYEAINVNVGPVLAFPNNRTPVLLRFPRSS